MDIPNPEAHFDANGNTIGLPHLRAMDWNYANRLSRAVVVDRSTSGQPDDAEYHVYGADGLRVRRVTERLVNGQLEVTETTYLDECEMRRISSGGTTRLLRWTSHVGDGSTRAARGRPSGPSGKALRGKSRASRSRSRVPPRRSLPRRSTPRQ